MQHPISQLPTYTPPFHLCTLVCVCPDTILFHLHVMYPTVRRDSLGNVPFLSLWYSPQQLTTRFPISFACRASTYTPRPAMHRHILFIREIYST